MPELLDARWGGVETLRRNGGSPEGPATPLKSTWRYKQRRGKHLTAALGQRSQPSRFYD
jgi:hypothetical protein